MKNPQFCVSDDPEIIEMLDRIVRREGTSRAAVVRRLIRTPTTIFLLASPENGITNPQSRPQQAEQSAA